MSPYPSAGPARVRAVALLLAAIVQAALAWALLHGLAIVWPASRGGDALTAIALRPRAHAVPPDPPRRHRAASSPATMAPAPPGERPRAAIASPPRIVLAPPIAAAVTPAVDTDGAGVLVQGTGSGAVGTGAGTGGGGPGQGGSDASGPVKLSGEISAARDYPAASRELRLGDYVVLALTIDTDGAVAGCRVLRPSRDVVADAITCRLARERFRFRPARDAQGRPVRSTFGWQQRWFRPGGA